MELIEVIDKKATIQNVRNFFAEDFNHYLNLANKHLSDISSPTLDGSGISKSVENAREEKYVVNLDAVNCVRAVNDTINSCSYRNAQIIYMYYIKHMQDIIIIDRLRYQTSRYYQMKNEALFEFAERMDYWRDRDNASIKSLLAFRKVEL